MCHKFEIVTFLVTRLEERGGEINPSTMRCQNYSNISPLHLGIAFGDITIIRYLILDKGVNLETLLVQEINQDTNQIIRDNISLGTFIDEQEISEGLKQEIHAICAESIVSFILK